MCSAPDIPQPKPLPPPPDYADQAVRDAARAERDRAMSGSRRKSFITSGASSGPAVVPQVAGKQLLGQ
jgi:hypothetical protein